MVERRYFIRYGQGTVEIRSGTVQTGKHNDFEPTWSKGSIFGQRTVEIQIEKQRFQSISYKVRSRRGRHTLWECRDTEVSFFLFIRRFHCIYLLDTVEVRSESVAVGRGEQVAGDGVMRAARAEVAVAAAAAAAAEARKGAGDPPARCRSARRRNRLRVLAHTHTHTHTKKGYMRLRPIELTR